MFKKFFVSFSQDLLFEMGRSLLLKILGKRKFAVRLKHVRKKHRPIIWEMEPLAKNRNLMKGKEGEKIVWHNVCFSRLHLSLLPFPGIRTSSSVKMNLHFKWVSTNERRRTANRQSFFLLKINQIFITFGICLIRFANEYQLKFSKLKSC